MPQSGEIIYKGYTQDGGESVQLTVTREKLNEVYGQLVDQIRTAEDKKDGTAYGRGVYTLTQLMCAEAASSVGDSDMSNSKLEWGWETSQQMRTLGPEAVLEKLGNGQKIIYTSNTLNAKGDIHPNRPDWNADSASDNSGRTVVSFVQSRGGGYIIATTISGGPRKTDYSPTRVVTAIRGLGSSSTIEIPR